MEFTVFSEASGQLVSAADLRDLNEEASAGGARLVGLHKATAEKVSGRRISEDDVEKRGDGFCLKANPAIRVDARRLKCPSRAAT